MRQKMVLGQSLAEKGLITSEQLKKAQDEEKKTDKSLKKVLVSLGFIVEEKLVKFLSNKFSIPRIELNNYLIDQKVIDLVPEELARKHELIPILKIGNRLTCAMTDPWNLFALDELREKTGLIVEPGIATESEVFSACEQYYGSKSSLDEVIKSIEENEIILKGAKTEEVVEEELKKLEGMAIEPAVIRLVNMIIGQAVGEGASDVHVEPDEKRLRIRVCVDGMLHEMASPPIYFHPVLVSRIKIMANLNIAERRRPQDGRISVKVGHKDIDIRVSCVPTVFGEAVVMRILDVSTALFDLIQIGFSKGLLSYYEKLIVRPHGIILVTGPTGSGKTTTLYSSLDKINNVEENIITIEDPVEYNLPGIRQIQVNPRIDLTFANGLRSILRQDPDIIMVGEIRDKETAEIAVHAALTGHLVFSTLHTNDAPGAIVRLIDMGIEPFLISYSVVGIIAQRLVRKICKNCKEVYKPSDDLIKNLKSFVQKKISEITFYKGAGCLACMNTGYKGRIGIFELLLVDDKIRNLVVARASVDQIRNYAIFSGMITLKADGINKVLEGVTTIEEILRVTQED